MAKCPCAECEERINHRITIVCVALCVISIMGVCLWRDIAALPPAPYSEDPYIVLTQGEEALIKAINNHTWANVDGKKGRTYEMLHEELVSIAKTRELIAVTTAERGRK